MMGVTIDKQIANCLYTGLCTDTGCFRYSNTSATTLRIAASLMDAGADVAEINRIMFDTKSRARLNVERLAMESITFYENGRFDIMEITEEMMKQSGATEGDIEGLAALPRQVEGVLIAATLRELKKKKAAIKFLFGQRHHMMLLPFVLNLAVEVIKVLPAV